MSRFFLWSVWLFSLLAVTVSSGVSSIAGSELTDASIRQQIEALGPNGGAIRIPAGIWLIEKSLVIDMNNVLIQGEEGTILQAAPDLQGPLFHTPPSAWNESRNHTYSDLQMRGKASDKPEGTGILIGDIRSDGGLVKNVVVRNCSIEGFEKSIHQASHHDRLCISDSEIERCQVGLYLENDGHEFLIDRCRFAYCEKAIASIPMTDFPYAPDSEHNRRAEGLRIHGTNFFDNRCAIYATDIIWGSILGSSLDYGRKKEDIGIYAENWYHMRVAECEFLGDPGKDGNGACGVKIVGRAVQAVFSGNHFGDAHDHAIHLVDGGLRHTVDVRIMGNYFHGMNPIRIENGTRVTLSSNSIKKYTPGGTAAEFNGCRGLNIHGNSIETYQNGLSMTDCSQVLVSDNLLGDFESAAITLQALSGDQKHCTLNGNIFSKTTQPFVCLEKGGNLDCLQMISNDFTEAAPLSDQAGLSLFERKTIENNLQ